MKKRMMAGMITAAMILSLAGCGSGNKGTTAGTETASAAETVVETSAETQTEDNQTETAETESEAETISEEHRASIAAFYKDILEEINQFGVLPGGTHLDVEDSFDKTQNQFAIYDVDNDGRDELIFCYTTTSMAGMTARIYDYAEERGAAQEELSTFPMLTFYDNATIAAGVSHNQGYAGEFWPYTFYTYDAESDTFQAKYFVDAWDKSLSDVNYNGDAFPDDADKDGDGIVYYLDSPDGTEQGEPMDRDAYDAWFSENVGNEVELPFQNFTDENISNIQ